MLPQPATRLAVAVLASLVLLPVSLAAETKHSGRPACPTAEPFTSPDGCECPPGYGKILTGDGHGQCQRLLCPGNSPFEPARNCECPHNTARTKPDKNGKVSCVLQKDKAVPKQKAK
jgi:hypothetical protein